MPIELNLTEHTKNSITEKSLSNFFEYIRKDPVFKFIVEDIEKIKKTAELEERLTFLIDDFACINAIKIVEGCYHGCTFCKENAKPKISYMYFDDYKRIVETIEAVVKETGIFMVHQLRDAQLHSDGECLMYVQKDNKNSSEKRTAYHAVKRLKESKLFSRDIPGSDRLIICTAGFYDTDEDKSIIKGVGKIVDEAEEIFGYDKQTGFSGGIRYSMTTATRYYANKYSSIDAFPNKEEWRKIQIENFRIFRPLLEKNLLSVNIRMCEDTEKNRKMLHGYSTNHLYRVLEGDENEDCNILQNIMKEADYPKLEDVMKNALPFLQIKTLHKVGRGKFIENAKDYENFSKEKYSDAKIFRPEDEQDELEKLDKKGYPKVLISPNGVMARQNPTLSWAYLNPGTRIQRTWQLYLPAYFR